MVRKALGQADCLALGQGRDARPRQVIADAAENLQASDDDAGIGSTATAWNTAADSDIGRLRRAALLPIADR